MVVTPARNACTWWILLCVLFPRGCFPILSNMLISKNRLSDPDKNPRVHYEFPDEMRKSMAKSVDFNSLRRLTGHGPEMIS